MAEYISWDPGEKRTGVALWDKEGNALGQQILSQDDLDRFLHLMESVDKKPSLFIIEEYRVYSGHNHTGSKVGVVQVIGQLKAFARRYGIQVEEIKASSKGIAAAWSQTKIPQGHMPDDMAAYLIGYWYLHEKLKLIKPKVMQDYKDGKI